MKSTDKLVFSLANANAPLEMIRLAKDNHYHDFKSELATPCTQLVNDLAKAIDLDQTNAKLRMVRDQAINGVFDADKEESDEWAASPEGQAILRELTGEKP